MGIVLSRSTLWLWKELSKGIDSFLIYNKKRKDVTITENWLLFSYHLQTNVELNRIELDNNSVHDIIVGFLNHTTTNMNVVVYIDDLVINRIKLMPGKFSYILPCSNILVLNRNRDSFVSLRIQCDRNDDKYEIEVLCAQCLTNHIRNRLFLHGSYSIFDDKQIIYDKHKIRVVENSCCYLYNGHGHDNYFIPSLKHL